MNISEDDLVLIEETTEEYLDFKVPRLAMIDLLSDNEGIFNNIKEFGMDTCTRDELMSVISVFLTGEKIPTFGDVRNGLEQIEFWKRLNRSATDKGWIQ